MKVIIGRLRVKEEMLRNPASWVAWSIMSFYSVLQLLLQGSVGVIAEGIKDSFNTDATGVSLLSSSFFISYILMQIPAGMIYDRFGIRRVAIIANSILVLGCLGLAFSPNLETAILSRVVIGFGASFGFVGLMFGIKMWFPLRQFAAIAAIAECLCMVGVATSNNILSIITLRFGWRVALGFCALLAIGQLLVMVMHLEDIDQKGKSSVRTANRVLGDLQEVLRRREVWLAGMYSAGVFTIVSVFVALWSIPFLSSAYKLDIVKATSISSTIYIGIAICSLVIGWLAKKFSVASIMSLGSGLSFTFSIFFLYLNLSISSLYLLAFLMGFCSAAYQLSFTLIAKSIPNRIGGAAIGATNMIMMLAAPILQTLIGIMISSDEGTGVLDGFEVYLDSSYRFGLGIIPASIFIAFATTFYMSDPDGITIKRWVFNYLTLKKTKVVQSVVE
ncbi:MAG: nitrate/nitrite transporter [Oligoflexales bacterium]